MKKSNFKITQNGEEIYRFCFFSFLRISFQVPYFIFFWGGGGLKSLKLVFDQFSRHFKQFWTTLIFSFLKTFFRYPIFCGGVLTNLVDPFSCHFWKFWNIFLLFIVEKMFVRHPCLHLVYNQVDDHMVLTFLLVHPFKSIYK